MLPAPAGEPAGAQVISILRGLWSRHDDGLGYFLDAHRCGVTFFATVRHLEPDVWSWQLDVHTAPASQAGEVKRLGDYAASLEAALATVERLARAA